MPAASEARFVTGSIMHHVVVMAGTGAVGLMAVFAVDLLNLFYISLLGQQSIAAAIGFAGVVGFFQTSVLIGLTIGVGAVVARTIGAGNARAARHIAGSGLVLVVLTGLIVGLCTVALLTSILDTLGASGETRRLAESFLTISSPSLPLLAAGMCCSGLLRCIGDARRAMNVTLFAALVTAVIDPILIFGLHLGLPGRQPGQCCPAACWRHWVGSERGAGTIWWRFRRFALWRATSALSLRSRSRLC